MREEERRRGRAAERSAFEEENETRALIFPSAPLRGKKLQFVFLLLLFQTPANPHAAPLGSFLSLSLRMRASLQAPSARYVESRSLFEGDRKDTRMSERERRKKKTPNDDDPISLSLRLPSPSLVLTASTRLVYLTTTNEAAYRWRPRPGPSPPPPSRPAAPPSPAAAPRSSSPRPSPQRPSRSARAARRSRSRRRT
jgi:hypothetical protein